MIHRPHPIAMRVEMHRCTSIDRFYLLKMSNEERNHQIKLVIRRFRFRTLISDEDEERNDKLT